MGLPIFSASFYMLRVRHNSTDVSAPPSTHPKPFFKKIKIHIEKRRKKEAHANARTVCFTTQLFKNFNGREKKPGKLIHFANFHFIDQENRSSPISQANSRTLPKIHDGFPFSAINTEPILVLTISRAESWLYSRVSVPYSSGAVGCRCSEDCRTHSLGGQRHAELDKYRHNFLNSSGISPGVSFAQRPPSGCP